MTSWKEKEGRTLGSPFGRQNRPLDPIVPALCRALMSAHRDSPKGSIEQSVCAVRTGTCRVLSAYEYVQSVYCVPMQWPLRVKNYTHTHTHTHTDIRNISILLSISISTSIRLVFSPAPSAIAVRSSFSSIQGQHITLGGVKEPVKRREVHNVSITHKVMHKVWSGSYITQSYII